MTYNKTLLNSIHTPLKKSQGGGAFNGKPTVKQIMQMPDKKYAPSPAVMNTKAGLAAASMITGPFSFIPGTASAVYDLGTSARYAMDGQWENAKEDLISAGLNAIPTAGVYAALAGMGKLQKAARARAAIRSAKGAMNLKDLSGSSTIRNNMTGLVQEFDKAGKEIGSMRPRSAAEVKAYNQNLKSQYRTGATPEGPAELMPFRSPEFAKGGMPCYECGGRYAEGGYYDCPDQEKDPVTGKCSAEVARGKEAAAANKVANADMNAWAKQVAAMDKENARQDAAQYAGQLGYDYDWMQSPVDKAEKKAAMAGYKQFFQQNPNTFVPDDTSGFSPEQKYIIASKLKQKVSTPMGSKAFKQKFNQDPNFFDLGRLQSDIVPTMGGWSGIRNWMFNNKAEGGIIEDPMGQWAHPGKNTRIPGSDITMQGVPYPVYGVGSNGQEQMMYPEQEYDFGGSSYVDEYPMMQNGGGLLSKSVSCSNCGWSWKAIDGGSDPLTCHKCGGIVKMQRGGTAYVDSVLNANKALNWVQRLYSKNTPSMQIPGVKGPSTHFMESGDGRVYPTVVQMPNGSLKYLGKDAFNYADSTKSYIQFPSDAEATWFGQNYKQGTGVLPKNASGGQHGGLDRWFAEKWVDVKTGKACGRQEGEKRKGYPACRPSKRVSSATPKTSSELSSSEREKFKREKTSSERIDYNHKREFGGLINNNDMYNLEMMGDGGNTPTNPSLWSRAKAAAKAKYDVYPSAYANGFAAKWYKSRGGGWRKAEYGMEVMGQGGTNNPGFEALPEYVQAKILSNMGYGGYYNPIMEEGGEPNGGMALGQMSAVVDKMSKLRKFVSEDENLDPWIASKLAVMDDSAAAIADYMMYNPEAQGGEEDMEEEEDYEQEEMPEMGRGGYTVTRSSDRKGKTHKVTGPDGTVKYFGDSKLGQHPKDPERKKAFYARHKKNLAGNPYFRAFARATWAEGGEMDMMGQGGTNNPGFNALPEYVQAKILSNMAQGGSTFSGNAWYANGGTNNAGFRALPEFVQNQILSNMAYGGIHINPANEGKFTASAKKAGMGVQEFASQVLANKEDYSSTQVKRANFARNAAGWKKAMGGPVVGQEIEVSAKELEELRKQGYQFEIL